MVTESGDLRREVSVEAEGHRALTGGGARVSVNGAGPSLVMPGVRARVSELRESGCEILRVCAPSWCLHRIDFAVNIKKSRGSV